MDKTDIKKQYDATRSAKMALDHMLRVAPPEVRDEFRSRYDKDTGPRYMVTTSGVPASVRLRNRKKTKTKHASRGQYLAASAAIRTAMHVRRWSA